MAPHITSIRDTDRVADLFEGMTVAEVPKQRYAEDELVERFRGADAAFVHSENTYGEGFFAALEDLQVIAKASSGIDNIDLEAATAHGVVVLFVPGGNRYAVGEYVVTLVLALFRRLPWSIAHLEAGGWRSPDWEGRELRGKTVGFVGFGATGSTAAERLVPFGVDVVVYDPYIDEDAVAPYGGSLVDLPELLDAADVVSIHARLTPETRGLIGADELARLDDDAVLVNTARGPIVDEAALVEALDAGTLAGAAVDVYHDEPPGEDHPLLGREDVIATPHLAGATVETRTEILRTAAAQVATLLRGEPVDDRYVANPEVWDDA